MEQYLDIKAVAKLTNIKMPTLRKYIQNNRIPYVRVGRLIRFRPSQIEAWLLRNERNTIKINEQLAMSNERFLAQFAG